MTTLRDLHRYDVNLSLVFTEVPLLERPAAAAAAGFDAVELWWPFAGPQPPAGQVDALVAAIADAGVRLVSLNFDAGDMPAGDRGLLSDPATVDRFRANVPVVVGIAERLGCGVLNALVGNRRDGMDAEAQLDLAVEQLAFAASAAAAVGAVVVVEALSPAAAPRYPVHSTAAAADLVRRAAERAGVPVRLCYDVFHMEQAEGALASTVRRHLDAIAHVQIADVPGRGQPGTGEIPFGGLLADLAAMCYDGHVGLEYQPTAASADSFGWLDEPAPPSASGASAPA